MAQEIQMKNENITNNESKQKTTVFLLIIIIFAGIYFYYSHKDSAKVAEVQQTNIKQIKTAPIEVKKDKIKTPLTKQTTTVKKTESASQKTTNLDKTTKQGESPDLRTKVKENSKIEPLDNKTALPVENSLSFEKISLTKLPGEENEIIEKNNTPTPTNKDEIAKIAILNTGKADPFSGSAIRSYTSTKIPGQRKNIYSIGSGSLPSFDGNLPLPPMPKGVYGNNNFNTPQKTYTDEIEIKGFIGNKVIAMINGSVESLSVNEKYRGVKVVKVDPINMTAKFNKNGKIITKSIKSLSGGSNVKMIKLVN